jgi:hemoglobin
LCGNARDTGRFTFGFGHFRYAYRASQFDPQETFELVRIHALWLNKFCVVEPEEALMSEESLYERLGGYDVIVAAIDEILLRLMNDGQLGRFWRTAVARERQLLIDYLCSAAGGPINYTGRGMKCHVGAALDHLSVGDPERGDLLGLIEGLKGDIVEC